MQQYKTTEFKSPSKLAKVKTQHSGLNQSKKQKQLVLEHQDFDNIQEIQELNSARSEVSQDIILDEAVRNQVAQIYFFLGITYRSLGQFDDAVLSYQSAISHYQYYTDCYYNLGNIFSEDKKDYATAELCYQTALESLEESSRIQIYHHLEENAEKNEALLQSPEQSNQQRQTTPTQTLNQIQSHVSYGRICNMIGETNKNKQDFEAAIKYYLKGITYEPGNNENFIDLAKLCSQLGEMELSNIVLIFGKAVQQIKLLEKWLENFDEMFDENELVFEIVQDETIQKEGENVATGQE